MPLEVEIEPRMSPGIKLVVYYIREDGEIVADNIKLKLVVYNIPEHGDILGLFLFQSKVSFNNLVKKGRNSEENTEANRRQKGMADRHT